MNTSAIRKLSEKDELLELNMENTVLSLILALLIGFPLAYKWELNLKTAFLSSVFIGIIVGFILNILVKVLFLNLLLKIMTILFLFFIISISIILVRFYRDPDRIAPEDKNIILSPADGKIRYIKKIDEEKVAFSEKKGKIFPLDNLVRSKVLSNRGHLIGITMTYLDVHVNRASIGGIITLIKPIKGSYKSLKKSESVFENERVLTIIDNGQFKVGILQIASRLVRKIVLYIEEGQRIKRGERIGIIKFGSQVDLILPDLPSLKIEVIPETRVKAGISIIATFEGSG